MLSKVHSTRLLAAIARFLVFAIASLAPISLAVAAESGVTSEILAAAKAEGQVTYYTSADLVLANKLKAAFEAKYGIKVNVLRLSSSLIFNRAVQEFDIGINAADTVETSVMNHFVEMKAKKMLQPFTPATVNLIRSPKLYDPENYWHSVKLELTSMNYNKDLLKGDAVPKTWKDLIDPKYSGKVVQGHIKSSGDTALIAFNLVKMYGWEYFEALRKNNVLTMQACTQVELVARGERLIMMCDYSQLYTARAQNLTVIGAVLPQDGVFMLAGPLAILAKAPHPNAAKVLVNWLLSPEGQTIYVEGGDASSIESPEVKLPADFPNLKNYKLIDTDIDEFRKWLPGGVEKFVELFGG
jgi:iron(III) transport system substrate-binding protein